MAGKLTRANLRRDDGVPSSGAELPGVERARLKGHLWSLIWQVFWAGTTGKVLGLLRGYPRFFSVACFTW